ncbi:uncharacterized protein LOC141647344 [Silene latifolia]|uniref:uncharacterized protein LOC141647344 n=1 Tax=Silene latifolia TaxID=37657 RepID=UPI003D787685
MTWTNKQDIDTLVWSKLDRALTNVAWQSQYPATSADFLPAGVSDHSPILVTVLKDKHSGSRFSFLNCWIDHPTYPTLVQEAWMEPVKGSLIFTLFSRLKNVQKRLRTLHKDNFTQIDHRIKTCRGQLYDYQERIQDNISSASLYAQERELMAKYIKLRAAESTILKQKTKIDHISYNDSSSKYFFSRIHERQQQQIIGHI